MKCVSISQEFFSFLPVLIESCFEVSPVVGPTSYCKIPSIRTALLIGGWYWTSPQQINQTLDNINSLLQLYDGTAQRLIEPDTSARQI